MKTPQEIKAETIAECERICIERVFRYHIGNDTHLNRSGGIVDDTRFEFSYRNQATGNHCHVIDVWQSMHVDDPRWLIAYRLLGLENRDAVDERDAKNAALSIVAKHAKNLTICNFQTAELGRYKGVLIHCLGESDRVRLYDALYFLATGEPDFAPALNIDNNNEIDQFRARASKLIELAEMCKSQYAIPLLADVAEEALKQWDQHISKTETTETT